MALRTGLTFHSAVKSGKSAFGTKVAALSAKTVHLVAGFAVITDGHACLRLRGTIKTVRAERDTGVVGEATARATLTLALAFAACEAADCTSDARGFTLGRLEEAFVAGRAQHGSVDGRKFAFGTIHTSIKAFRLGRSTNATRQASCSTDLILVRATRAGSAVCESGHITVFACRASLANS